MRPGDTAWLSRGFETLLYDLERGDAPEIFDVVIVGSGYGGAVAAAELAGCRNERGEPARVCVLERGKEYLPGMFPARLADLPGHVRFTTEGATRPRGRREGLFDLRIGPDVNAVVANGLGGGSLINAGVMEAPLSQAFDGWPGSIPRDLDEAFFDKVSSLLGAAKGQTIEQHPDGAPQKFAALRALARGIDRARGEFRPARITVAMATGRNAQGVLLEQCKRCGDCATGCNHGAKISLDVNLLAKAERAGARIYTGATVLRIARERNERNERNKAWLLETVHTDRQLRERQVRPVQLRARKVILAAGTFGSTEILLRSRSEALRFSPRLGQRFSSNGDAIAVAFKQKLDVNAVADESMPPDDRAVGPTITGIVDLRADRSRAQLIEEVAIPGPLRRLFEETVTTVNALHELGEPDVTTHDPEIPAHDPCAVDAQAIGQTSAFVMMGDDGANGALELVEDESDDSGDGALRVRWPQLREHPLFASQVETLQDLGRSSATGGRVLPNPLWQLLPASMSSLLDSRRGPLLTVHPLGGCPIGTDAEDGVVNHLGQVFDLSLDRAGREAWPDLVVLDGSIVRNALGTNPALTIAALALRAVSALRDQWGYSGPDAQDPVERRRPRFRAAPAAEAPRSTEFQIVERTSGKATLRAKDGGEVHCIVEISVRFKKHAIAGFMLPRDRQPVPMARRLEVEEGQLRVFLENAWNRWRENGEPEARLDDITELRAPLSGTLTLLQRERSTFKERRCRAMRAWLPNRGLRDAWQRFVERVRSGHPFGVSDAARAAAGDPKADTAWAELRARARDAKALASRAGEVRRLQYSLKLGECDVRNAQTRIDTGPFVRDARIVGVKRLTYGRRSNPWRQLMEQQLQTFPGAMGNAPLLKLDTRYLAEQGVPLFKVVGQNDQVAALADAVSVLAYFLRLLLNIHVWSFRRPDAPAARTPQRLPKRIPWRLPEPQIREIQLDELADRTPVRMRLTRYRPCRPKGRPVVMIHGYSASGTTFAHHAVRPNMAEYFYWRRRDVWVLDLRTSSGMPTARHPWAFEDAALADIPVAIDEICRVTGEKSVDVFAHCMGSVMLSMAVLDPPEAGERFYNERRLLPQRIHRAVLSQVSPIVVMTPANTFRGYAMRYLRHFLPMADYQFRVRPDPGLVDQLLDRLLATLPYPEQEFDIENPPWWRFWRRTPFVGTRHRMDALYGRDFNLADEGGTQLLNNRVLEYIDDLFGPLSIETVAQVIHFARSQVITNRAGRNEYVLPRNLITRWTFPTACVQGADNGLSDIATLRRLQARFKEEANIDVEIQPFPQFGHQDSLIGRRAGEVFAWVFDFLCREDADGDQG